MMRTTGRITDIACIVISWSTNPAADPCTTAVVGTSDQTVDQALSDLVWNDPQQVAAMFQTHYRLQHQKEYVQKLTNIMQSISEVLLDIVLTKGKATTPLNTVEKIILTAVSKEPSTLQEPPPSASAGPFVHGDSPSTAAEHDNASPSLGTDRRGPARSCGKETTSQPLPPGYIEDPVVVTIKLLRLGSKGNTNLHAYFTAIFYDWLNVAHGAEPFLQLSTLDEYRARGVPSFQSKTFLHTLFLAGFHIENWPYCAPTPKAIDDTDFASPQSWASWKITRVIKQFCHPEPTRRLRLVCRAEDTTRMPSITHPADAAGIPAPDSIDSLKAKVPKGAKYWPDACYCALHIETGNYHWRYMDADGKQPSTSNSIPPVVKVKSGKSQLSTRATTRKSSRIDKGKQKSKVAAVWGVSQRRCSKTVLTTPMVLIAVTVKIASI
ncbi:hypothetical protein K439DRAFT_332823 [Ramaria rubella]|nr:hypothetical protein K439DRAFT_332823 [Ramaria rubella]